MKLLIKKKKFTLWALALVSLLASPIIAAVSLNTFQSGETISASAVNENFTNLDQGLDDLQEKVDNICDQSGQVVWSAEVNKDGTIQGKQFTCPGLEFTVTRETVGTYSINMTGIARSDIVAHVNGRMGIFSLCNPRIISSSLWVFCGSQPDNSDVPFYITLIRR